MESISRYAILENKKEKIKCRLELINSSATRNLVSFNDSFQGRIFTISCSTITCSDLFIFPISMIRAKSRDFSSQLQHWIRFDNLTSTSTLQGQNYCTSSDNPRGIQLAISCSRCILHYGLFKGGANRVTEAAE